MDIEVAGDDGVGVGEELSLAVECYLLARGFGLVAGVGGGAEAEADEKRREDEEARHRGSEKKIWKIGLIRSKEAISDGARGGRERQVPTVNPHGTK